MLPSLIPACSYILSGLTETLATSRMVGQYFTGVDVIRDLIEFTLNRPEGRSP